MWHLFVCWWATTLVGACGHRCHAVRWLVVLTRDARRNSGPACQLKAITFMILHNWRVHSSIWFVTAAGMSEIIRSPRLLTGWVPIRNRSDELSRLSSA